MEGTGLVQLLPVGVLACAPTGEILFHNDRAAELWGQAPERFDPAVRYTGAHRLLRRDGSELAPEDAPIAIALRTGQEIEGAELILERPDGTRLRVLSHVRVVDDDLGIRVGAVESFHVPGTIKAEKLAVRDRATTEPGTERDTTERMVDVSTAARSVAARFADRALSMGSAITVDAPAPVIANADASRLDAVLCHVVDDALRHARGRRVDVRVLSTGVCAEVSVSNHGYGTTFTMSLPLAQG